MHPRNRTSKEVAMDKRNKYDAMQRNQIPMPGKSYYQKYQESEKEKHRLVEEMKTAKDVICELNALKRKLELGTEKAVIEMVIEWVREEDERHSNAALSDGV